MATSPEHSKTSGILGTAYNHAKNYAKITFLIAGAATVGYFSVNEVYHIAASQLSPPTQVERPYSRSAEKAALEGKVTIGIYNINFSNDAVTYDSGSIESYVQTVFRTLGIKADVTYRNIYPYAMEKEHPEIGGAFGNAANFEEFVRFSSLVGKNTEYTFRHIRGGKMMANNPMFMIIDYLEAFRIQPFPRPDISIVIADFEDSTNVVASTRYESNVYYGQPLCLVDRIFGGKKRDWRQIAESAAHEALHRLTLPHPNGLVDIMSKQSTPLEEIIKNVPWLAPWLAIGNETRLNWRKIKKDYTSKRQKAPEIKASPSSLYYLGNNRGFDFYQSHRYPRRWPKEMVLGGLPRKVEKYLK